MGEMERLPGGITVDRLRYTYEHRGCIHNTTLRLATIALAHPKGGSTFVTVAFYTESISGMKGPELVPVASPGPAPGFFFL